MAHDFTRVYAPSPGVSQAEVLHRLAGSDCADATAGWGRPGMNGCPGRRAKKAAWQ